MTAEDIERLAEREQTGELSFPLMFKQPHLQSASEKMPRIAARRSGKKNTRESVKNLVLIFRQQRLLEVLDFLQEVSQPELQIVDKMVEKPVVQCKEVHSWRS